MYQLTYLFVGMLGVLTAIGAMQARLDWLTRFLSALMSTVIWGVWALESFRVEVVSSGVVVGKEYESLAVIAIALAALMLIVTVQYGLQGLQTSGEAPNGRLEDMEFDDL